jgi:hypothetical protein
VILTVKTSAVNLGITGIALDGQGNLYLAEFDDDRALRMVGQVLPPASGSTARPTGGAN